MAELLIPNSDWRDHIPENEERADMIDVPESQKAIQWQFYLVGREGYLGRDNLESGGMYFTDGRVLCQTEDLTEEKSDKIHFKELRAFTSCFEEKKFPETMWLMGQEFVITDQDKDSELWVQLEEVGENPVNRWTVFKTYKTLCLAVGPVEGDARRMRMGVQRVGDFFMINQF